MAAVANKDKSATTVTVACKYGPGVFLRVHRMEEYTVPVLGGGTRIEKRAIQEGPTLKVNGPSVAKGERPDYPVVGGLNVGFALTSGIPKDFFDRWLKENADSDMVKNGLIFANPDVADVKSEAKDNRDRRSGIEPLVPDDDPRNPKSPGNRLRVESGSTDADDE